LLVIYSQFFRYWPRCCSNL